MSQSCSACDELPSRTGEVPRRMVAWAGWLPTRMLMAVPDCARVGSCEMKVWMVAAVAGARSAGVKGRYRAAG